MIRTGSPLTNQETPVPIWVPSHRWGDRSEPPPDALLRGKVLILPITCTTVHRTGPRLRMTFRDSVYPGYTDTMYNFILTQLTHAAPTHNVLHYPNTVDPRCTDTMYYTILTQFWANKQMVIYITKLLVAGYCDQYCQYCLCNNTTAKSFVLLTQ